MLSITPEWGRPGSATDRLWSAPDTRLAVEAGYGIGLGHDHGVLTPYAGLTLGDAGSRTERTGARWQVDPNAVLALEGTRQSNDGREADNQLILRLALRF